MHQKEVGCNDFTCPLPPSPTEITCDDIPDPENGQITHVPDTHAPFEYGNQAHYSCYVDGERRIGYGLTGGNHTRTCTGDGSSPVGYWTGKAPTCERERDQHIQSQITLCAWSMILCRLLTVIQFQPGRKKIIEINPTLFSQALYNWCINGAIKNV